MHKMSDWITTGERPELPFVHYFAKAAGSGGKSDDADDDEDDDEDEDDEDDDPDEDKSEDELRDELKRVRASLKGTSDSDARKRAKIRKLTRELEDARKPKAGKKKAADDDDAEEIDVDAIRREGETAGIARAKRAEAKAELLAAGVSRDKIALALRNVDLDDMDLDNEGLDGIDDAIAELRTALPALFVKKRTRRESVAGEGDRDGHDVSSKRKPKTASEIAADRVLGRK